MSHRLSPTYNSSYFAECTQASHKRGSCAHYGCGNYSASFECQCNNLCSRFGNCCADFVEYCCGIEKKPVPACKYRHWTQHVVPGADLELHYGQSLQSCKELCDLSPLCLAFEYGTFRVTG